MKKYIIATAVVCLLIIFPLVSWVYLSSGLTYRKDVRTELTSKGTIDSDLAKELGLEFKTTLVHHYESDNKALLEKLKIIYDQFDDNEDFQLVSMIKDSELYDPSDSINWKLAAFPDNDTTRMLFENNFTLIDTGLNIRNHYNSQDSSITNMIEQIAFILPVKKDLDIELRRQKEK